MHASDVRHSLPFRYGAYFCFSVPDSARASVSAAPVPAFIDRLRLRNEFEAEDGHPTEAVAFLRRVDSTPGDIADDGLLLADAVVHVAAPTLGPIDAFCQELARVLPPQTTLRVLHGVSRPTNYTGNAMHNFAYAEQVVQQPGAIMPNGFLVPMSRTAAWWEKDWMERHSYFLPRYDDAGHMAREGHVLVAAPGIESLMRRTYKQESEPAPADAYDYVNYFECTDDSVPTYHEVCCALRDVERNPEWAFMREGPTWHGRRVATWGQLFS